MFDQYGAVDVKSAVDPLIEQMIELLGMMNSFLEDVLGTFIAEVILEGSVTRQAAGKVLAPEFGSVAVPFWTAMPAKSK